jgi:septation ring formation regulator EzrA
MIGVITIIIVCIVLLIRIYITNKINNKRIKELEERLNEYYKRRENNLMERFRDIEQ